MGASTVTTMAANPLSSAPRTIASTSASVWGTYTWHQHGVVAADGTLTCGCVLADDTTYGVPVRAAPRATAHSPSGCAYPPNAHGASRTGAGTSRPKNDVAVLTWLTSMPNRGTNRHIAQARSLSRVGGNTAVVS